MSAPLAVLVIGAGAVGGFYGALLARAGHRVSVVVRSDFAAVRRDGLQLRSPLGALSFRPADVFADVAAAAAAGRYDLVMITTKATADPAALIAPLLPGEATFLLLQNGLDVEQPLTRRYPELTLLSALAFICTSRVAPGVIEHQAYGAITLGAWPPGSQAGEAMAARLAADWQAAGVPAEHSADIAAARWRKCLWNAPFNPLSVIAGASTAELLAVPEIEALVRRAMGEVREVAQAAGIELPAAAIEQNLHNTRQMPPYRTSMLLDYEAGRPLEREAILGSVLRRAQAADVAVPTLQALDALLALRERQRAGGAA